MSDTENFKRKPGFEIVEELGEGGKILEKQEEEKKVEEEEYTEEEEEKKEESTEEESSEEEEKKEEDSEEEEKEEESTEEEEEKKEDNSEEEESEEEEEEEKRSLNNISELTEDKFETPEDLYQAYKELEAQNETVSGKTVIESINDVIKEEYGEDVTLFDLVEVKNTNFSEMAPLDLIKEHLLFEDPEITDKEIRAELMEFDLMKESESSIREMIEDEDNPLTQEKYDVIEAKMLRRARTAKNELTDYQDSIDLEKIEIQTPGKTVDQRTQPTEEELKAELDYYKSVIGDLKEVTVDVGTKEEPFKLKISVSDEDRNGIEDFVEAKDGKNFIDRRWLGDDGLVDMEQLSMDVHKIQNYERDLKVAFTQGKSEGVKEAIKKNDKIDLKGGKGGLPPENKTDKDIYAQIAREIN